MRPGNLLRRALNHVVSPCTPNNPGPWVGLAFILVYLALIRYCSNNFYRDPTSAFFDPARGYERHYSLDRQKQADAFLEKPRTSPGSRAGVKAHPKLCIGIATVGRENEQYIRSTIGSLLESLSDSERNEIYLAVLIAHTEPDTHPIYSEGWLITLADKVLLYDVPAEQRDQLIEWENEKNYARKAIFDYTYVMQKCVDRSADWVAMVEDDTLAVADWYPRLMASLTEADNKHRADGHQGEWLYLRMFFTEEFLGWNSEEWPSYLFAAVGRVAFNMAILLVLRRYVLKNTLTNAAIAVWSFIYVPALIALYFLAGRLSVQPLQPGVHEMSNFGCCAQGLVFSSSMATKTIDHLRQVGAGFVDQLIETWANNEGYVRWAVMPSLLQHIGVHSSKGDDMGDQAKWARSVAEKIWNFGFELYDERAF